MGEQKELFKKLNPNMTVKEIQEYVKKIIELRGFTNINYQDELILLMEEVGELAKAIRKKAPNSTIDKQKILNYTEIEEEIADVFIVLMQLSNILNIDIIKSVIEKEKVNIERNWSKLDK